MSDPQRIMRVTQSPLNASIWFLDLACGHEVIVIRKTRPAKDSIRFDVAAGEKVISPRKVPCPKCAVPPEVA